MYNLLLSLAAGLLVVLAIRFGTSFGWNVLRARRTLRRACSVESRWFTMRSLWTSASVTAWPSVSTGPSCPRAASGMQSVTMTKTWRVRINILRLRHKRPEGVAFRPWKTEMGRRCVD